MLLFIAREIRYGMNLTYFNTSHVTVYPEASDAVGVLLQFQYISCYCLSTTLLRSYLHMGHFNTSHVTVYLTS